MTQVSAMLPNKLHLTLRNPPCAMPTATTLPIWQCVLDIGMPAALATTTLRVDPSSITKPLEKLTSARSVPTVLIT